MFESMIVGVDREEGGRDAIALANILRAEDAKLTLAYVYHGDRTSGADRAHRSRPQRSSARASCSRRARRPGSRPSFAGRDRCRSAATCTSWPRRSGQKCVRAARQRLAWRLERGLLHAVRCHPSELSSCWAASRSRFRSCSRRCSRSASVSPLRVCMTWWSLGRGRRARAGQAPLTRAIRRA